MHQRPRLIKVGEGERDAELDRRQRDAAFQNRLRRVPVGNGGAACGVVRCLGQPVGQRVDDTVLHRLVVGGGLQTRGLGWRALLGCGRCPARGKISLGIMGQGAVVMGLSGCVRLHHIDVEIGAPHRQRIKPE